MKNLFARAFHRGKLLSVVLFWGLSGTVFAFPCGMGYVDGSLTANPIADTDGAGDNYMCRDGDVGDNNHSAADLNSGNFFGFNSWESIDKVNTPDADGIGGNGILKIDNLNVTSGGDIVAGNWTFLQDLWQTFSALTIIEKDGNFSGSGIFWTAYKVDPTDLSGDWSMPSKNLSNMAVYGVRGGTPPPPPPPGTGVPIPGTLTLLLFGAAAWVSRRTAD